MEGTWKYMRKSFLLCILAAFLPIQGLEAQSGGQEAANAVNTEPGGLRLQSVSGFLSYYSRAVFGSSSTLLQDQTGVGAAATIAYSSFRERTGISIIYTPSYIVGLGDYGANAQNHVLSATWRHSFTPKWGYSLAASASVASLTEALFMPTSQSMMASTQATPEDFSTAMTTGRVTNDQLGAAISAAPLAASPSGLLLYGNRTLNSVVRSRISYSHSTRLTLLMMLEASRSQALKDGSVSAGSQPDYLVGQTTTGTGTVGIGYSLTPRSQLSADWSSTRVVSNLEQAYTHTAKLSLGHTISPRWFFQMHAGGGFVNPTRQFHVVERGLQYQAGGNIGYRNHAHTLLAAVDRSIGDTYGLSANGSILAAVTWNWHRPGALWSMTANFGEEWLTVTGFNQVNTWRGGAGVVRKVGPHMAVSTQYAYLSNVGFAGGLGPQSLQAGRHMVRMTVIWIPSERTPLF
jgi:hypothetical protein